MKKKWHYQPTSGFPKKLEDEIYRLVPEEKREEELLWFINRWFDVRAIKKSLEFSDNLTLHNLLDFLDYKYGPNIVAKIGDVIISGREEILDLLASLTKACCEVQDLCSGNQ